jgi:hypothetical protein
MTKRKYKEERKKILEKYGRPMSEIPDKYLKDRNGCWIWLRDSIDYKLNYLKRFKIYGGRTKVR